MIGDKKPFHETIILAIQNCPGPSTGEIDRLCWLIRNTRIPKNHDAIIKALEKYFNFPGGEKWCRLLRITKEEILSEKALAETKAKNQSENE